MEPLALILAAEELDNNDANFIKLIKFFGIDCRVMYIENDLSELFYNIKTNEIKFSCLALNCVTLQRIYNKREIANDFLSVLSVHIPFLFVYGVYPDKGTDTALKFITRGIISNVLKSKNHVLRFNISPKYAKICRQFSGLSFGPSNPKIDFTFKIEKQSNIISNLITIGTQPFFTKIVLNKCQIFLVASNQIIDPSELICEEFNVRSIFSQLIPALLFIKFVFKNRCWHKNSSHACLIIDDPLLRSKYGFLDYRKLITLMNQNNFSTTIAFIPWNYKRTDKRIADLLLKNRQKCSICIHGCDHTASEFGAKDINMLDRKAKIALERMHYHKEITGLEYDKLMVFPQGKFSSNAFEVLKSNNFLAAVNTETVPINNKERPTDCSALDVAIMDYHNFPLFLRRPNINIEDFALDLFIGRPALIYVHHDSFKDGGKDLIDFIRKINSIDSSIQWYTLGDIIKRSYMMKNGQDQFVHVKIYANNVIIKNRTNVRKRYIITKPESNKNVPIDHITINGEKTLFEVKNGYLKIVRELGPIETANLKIVYRDLLLKISENVSAFESIKVTMRRYLCELRDNYLSKNALIEYIALKIYRKIFKDHDDD
ncbi:MAG: hypothetical protein ACFFDN_16175 [Candidatus Hodarchaeota archaeon]